MDKLNIVETKEENEEKEILEDTESLIENTDIIEKKPKTKKFIYFFVIPLLVLVILVAILSTILSTIFALINIKNTNIINGVFIEGIDVSNLSKEQAKEKVNSVVSQHLSNEISLVHGEFEKTITPEQIDAKFDIDTAVDMAFSIGRTRKSCSK